MSDLNTMKCPVCKGEGRHEKCGVGVTGPTITCSRCSGLGRVLREPQPLPPDKNFDYYRSQWEANKRKPQPVAQESDPERERVSALMRELYDQAFVNGRASTAAELAQLRADAKQLADSAAYFKEIATQKSSAIVNADKMNDVLTKEFAQLRAQLAEREQSARAFRARLKLSELFSDCDVYLSGNCCTVYHEDRKLRFTADTPEAAIIAAADALCPNWEKRDA